MKSTTQALTQRLKTLGDPTRLRLVALCQQGECSVSELTRVIGQSQPRISQQLKQLCDAELLDRFRDGKRVFYRVPTGTSMTAPLRRLLELITADDPVFVADWNLLRQSRGERVVDLKNDRQDGRRCGVYHRAKWASRGPKRSK